MFSIQTQTHWPYKREYMLIHYFISANNCRWWSKCVFVSGQLLWTPQADTLMHLQQVMCSRDSPATTASWPRGKTCTSAELLEWTHTFTLDSSRTHIYIRKQVCMKTRWPFCAVLMTQIRENEICLVWMYDNITCKTMCELRMTQ